VAHKAGHALHTQLVTRLLADPTLWVETTVESDRQPAAAPPLLTASASAAD
jgi:UDP-3-O-acyl-N-acetylglucosamine deacetylase